MAARTPGTPSQSFGISLNCLTTLAGDQPKQSTASKAMRLPDSLMVSAMKSMDLPNSTPTSTKRAPLAGARATASA